MSRVFSVYGFDTNQCQPTIDEKLWAINVPERTSGGLYQESFLVGTGVVAGTS